jgi:hypothetical protein
MSNMKNIQQAKHELALSTKRGFPLVLSGLLFWTIAGVLGFFLPEEMTLWVYIFGVGLVFPAGILLSLAMKVDIFAKGNPLGALAGILGGVQILFAPIIIMLFFNEPRWVPFALGVLNGAHFLPYSWVYSSKAYVFQSVATTIVAALSGFLFINSTFVVTPLSIAVVFIISAGFLLKESKRDKFMPKYLVQ